MDLMWTVISLLYGYSPNLSETGKDHSGHHWSYVGDSGPNHWLDHYPTCGGHRQSPVDIRTGEVEYASWLDDFQFFGYEKYIGNTIKNNGHTASMAITDSLTLRGAHLNGDYQLAEMHMHWGNNNSIGSEHALDSKKRPAEIHFVHFAKRYGNLSEAMKMPDGLAVIGTFVEVVPDDNYAFENLANGIDSIIEYGAKTNLTNIRVMDFLPRNTKQFYHYRGSLTTPPCYESVMWFVMANTIRMSNRQLNRFRHLQEKIHEHVAATGSANSVASRVFKSDPVYIRDNFRPLQPLGTRKVYCNMIPVDRPKLQEFNAPGVKVSPIRKQRPVPQRAPVQSRAPQHRISPVHTQPAQAAPQRSHNNFGHAQPASYTGNSDTIHKGLSPNRYSQPQSTNINGVISNGNNLLIGNIATNNVKTGLFQHLQPDNKYHRHQKPVNAINKGGNRNLHVYRGPDTATVLTNKLNQGKSAPLLDYIFTQVNGLTPVNQQRRRYDTHDHPGISRPKDRIFSGLSDLLANPSSSRILSNPSLDTTFFQADHGTLNKYNNNGNYRTSNGRSNYRPPPPVSKNVEINYNSKNINIQNNQSVNNNNNNYQSYNGGASPTGQNYQRNSGYVAPTSYPNYQSGLLSKIKKLVTKRCIRFVVSPNSFWLRPFLMKKCLKNIAKEIKQHHHVPAESLKIFDCYGRKCDLKEYILYNIFLLFPNG